MYLVLSLFILFLLIFVIWLLMICPADVKGNMADDFMGRTFAHRGLHSDDIPENTLSAFRNALKKGYGIELDIRLTKDEKVVVFHDDTLQRMCGIDKRVDSFTHEELSEYTLGSDEHISLFSDVLELINGTQPLIVELKTCNDYKLLCLKAMELLDNYKGPYCIESFDPRIVHEFRRQRPKVFRGQLSCKTNNSGRKALGNFVLHNLLLNVYAYPHFIAYRHEDMKNIGFRLSTGLLRGYTAAWTVRDKSTLESLVKKQVEMIIFEGFEPENHLEYEI